MAKKHVPPSRARYEAENPVVSFRVTKDLHAKLEALKRWTGKSTADVFREAVGQQFDVAARVYRAGRIKGFREGYEAGEREFRVNYHCRACGELIPITSAGAKAEANRLMNAEGWGHSACAQ